MSPAQVIVKRDAQKGRADQGRAVEIDAGRDEVRFIPKIKIRPAQVRVRQQQGVSAFRVRWRNCPRIGTVRVPIFRLAFDRAGIDDKSKMSDALPMRDDVRGFHRQDDFDVVADLVGMFLGVVVDARNERVQVVAEFRGLRLIPFFSATRNAHRANPPVRVEIIAAPIFGGPSARVAIKAKNEIAVALRLRPTEAMKKPRRINAINVRNAPGVPKNFVARDRGCFGWLSWSRRSAGCRKESDEKDVDPNSGLLPPQNKILLPRRDIQLSHKYLFCLRCGHCLVIS